MSVIVLLIAAGGVVAAGFLAAFAWAVTSGQYDDITTPAVRMLRDDARCRPGNAAPADAAPPPGAGAPQPHAAAGGPAGRPPSVSQTIP